MGLFRTFLALLIVITHTTSPLKILHISGTEAIICFYVISGFLMSRILLQTYKSNIRGFYLNRFLKIYPVYLASLIISIICFIVIPTGHHNPIKLISELSEIGKISSLTYAAFSNVSIVGADLSRIICMDSQYSMHLLDNCPVNSIGSHNLLFIPQAWTLAIEITFYLIAPLVAIKSFRCIFLICFIQGIQVLLGDSYTILNNEAFAFSQLKYFLIGSMANLFITKFRQVRLRFQKSLSLVIALVTFAAANWGENYVFLATCTALFLMTQINQSETQFSKFIGQFSYPVYLTHYPFAKYFEDHIDPQWQFFVTASVSFLISYIIILILVNPLEKIRLKIKQFR